MYVAHLRLSIEDRYRIVRRLGEIAPKGVSLELSAPYQHMAGVIARWFGDVHGSLYVTQYCLLRGHLQPCEAVTRSALERAAALHWIRNNPSTALLAILKNDLKELKWDRPRLKPGGKALTQDLEERIAEVEALIGDEQSRLHAHKGPTKLPGKTELIKGLDTHPMVRGSGDQRSEAARLGSLSFIYSLASKRSHPHIITLETHTMDELTSLIPGLIGMWTASDMQDGHPWRQPLIDVSYQLRELATPA